MKHPGLRFPRPRFLAAALSLLLPGLLSVGNMPQACAALQPVAPTASAPTANATTIYIIPLNGPLTGNAESTLNSALNAAPAGSPVLLDLNSASCDGAVADRLLQALAVRRASGPLLAYVRNSCGPGTIPLATADAIYAPADAQICGDLSHGNAVPASLPVPLSDLEKFAAPVPYRVEIIRSLFEEGYSFAIGNTTIKAWDQLLNLTGESAARQYGDPPQPLLVTAVAPSLDQALSAYFKGQPFQAQIWTADGFVPRPIAATALTTSSTVAATPAITAAPSPASPSTTLTTPPSAAPDSTTSAPPAAVVTHGQPRVSVYVVPIKDEIDDPQLYILRRALKDAIENHVDAVVLDMNTPGGSVAVTLDMMEALSKFKGRTFTYVNPNALSAGSYIAVATNDIYFAPDGVMGAAAVVGGQGEDISKTMQLKINSYLIARVHALAGPSRYRADVQRAMMDADFEFKIGDKVIKPPGVLLSLTAKDAAQTYGEPPEPLLAAGIAPDLDSLLTQVYGKDGYTIRDFHLTWSEHLAKWLNSIAAILLGAGILLLFIEFKSSTFGLIGAVGVGLLVLVFFSSYVAGLAGYEPLLLFVLGLVLIALELFLFPGSIACGLAGSLCFFGSFIWAMLDVWPSEYHFGLTPESFARPLFNLLLGFALAVAGIALALRFLPQTRFFGRLVNTSHVQADTSAATVGAASATGATTLPEPGTRGVAMTDLRPLGEIEIAGGRYQARAVQGQIDRGSPVEVVSRKDFAILVKNAP